MSAHMDLYTAIVRLYACLHACLHAWKYTRLRTCKYTGPYNGPYERLCARACVRVHLLTTTLLCPVAPQTGTPTLVWGTFSPAAPPSMPAVFSFCAYEKASQGTTICTCTGTVRYGVGSTWVERESTGSVACSNDVFGDPAVGVDKTCECKARLYRASRSLDRLVL